MDPRRLAFIKVETALVRLELIELLLAELPGEEPALLRVYAQSNRAKQELQTVLKSGVFAGTQV